MSCQHCIDPDGERCLPAYGVAPHTCFYKIPGAAIGQSVLLPRQEWPDNFIEDAECPGQGMWYCEHCREGMPNGAQVAAQQNGESKP
jgi:hypothetical protein